MRLTRCAGSKLRVNIKQHVSYWTYLNPPLPSPQDPSNLEGKQQQHQAFEAELQANKGRVDSTMETTEELIKAGHYAADVIRWVELVTRTGILVTCINSPYIYLKVLGVYSLTSRMMYSGIYYHPRRIFMISYPFHGTCCISLHLLLLFH